jgi:hypothetical protein
MHVLFWMIALLLLLAAAACGVLAWRMARGVRERESARVELLKALAFPDASAAPASGPSISNWTDSFLSEQETAPAADAFEPAPPIFGERGSPLTTVPRWWIAIFAIGAAIVLVVLLYARAPAAPATVDAQTTAVPDRPIELIALQYRLEDATALDISGLVRNPAEGRELPQLMAVVNLLDAHGRILTSETTPLERSGLEAGQTSAFSLVFRGVTGTVASYQVGFRLPSGDTIRHVDRRASERAAKTPSF